MMRLQRDFGTLVENPVVPGMSANVVFASSRLPSYRIGVYNQMLDARNDPKIMSMKEVIARETAQLLEQQMRLSVRDLASKFEKGLAAAARLSDEVDTVFILC
ncbi:hypothetical protein SAY86_008143 [Trapa natans]|uniref:Stomatal closure-related actin-binding protein actin-binding domain-containing protein n=1 Tax=Trapa natans TaxID=22666 RepID=A0AAN7K7Z4_TRANT|nr:hypothetical protein SAY86_008143 [Trapa natans]